MNLTDNWNALFEKKYHISLINTAFSISTPVQYYFNINNIDIIIFISSAPSNSTTCHHATPGIMVNYHVIDYI